MQHKESSVKIFTTTEYNRFRMISGNRALNQRKIDRIIKDINNGNNMLPYKPIEVRESGNSLDILDGQHRMFVSKKLKHPVSYIIVEEEKSMAEIATVNSNVEKWKYADYINCYAAQNNNNYSKLKEFLDTYHLAIGAAIYLLATGNPTSGGTNTNLLDSFYKGTFEIKFWDEAVEIVERAKLFESFNGCYNRNFIIAINKIHLAGKIPVEDVLAAFKRNPDKLLVQGSPKQYIYNLEQIVNIGKQKRIVIA